jgi:uncharacterized membrane protein YidH (DUF202 family)
VSACKAACSERTLGIQAFQETMCVCVCLQYAGVIISPIAILFMMYALFMYKRRTVQILRRANVRYDDQSGPVMLVILLIVATLASLVLTAYGTLR